jgi:hypothetical protein
MDIETLKVLGLTQEDLAERVTDQLTESIRDETRKRIDALVSQRCLAIIDQAIANAVGNVLDLQYTQVDQWGEPKGNTTTLRDVIKNKAVNWLGEYVDSQGKTVTDQRNHYGDKHGRAQWMVDKACKEAVDAIAKQQVAQVTEKTKAEVKEIVSKLVAEQVLAKMR